ncbi:MAG: hypothetical protein HC918_13070 [Oscillatoriales cyanobacterium SM2_1_8]|nr:hypothetical protein [Oscillatoriales cyanobacterium SM2_1_8]
MPISGDAPILTLALWQERLQALQETLQISSQVFSQTSSQASTGGAAAIAEGLALCQNFEMHKNLYLSPYLGDALGAWPSENPIAPVPQPTFLSPTENLTENLANKPRERELDSEGTAVFNQSGVEGSAKENSAKENMENAVETGRATGHVSTAPEEHMLSHCVELTKHMRLLAADFSMFRAARNPSTQENRRQQVLKRLAVVLAFCQALQGKRADTPA